MVATTRRRVIPKTGTSTATKTRRVAVRLTEELGARLDLAVAIAGRTQSDFVTEAIAEKASAVVHEQRYLELTDRDMEALVEALENPPEPNAAMLRSIARWRDRGAPW